MTPPAQRATTPTRRRALRYVRPDQTYLVWRRAQNDATRAYAGWRTAGVEDRRSAFAGYLAALDREEAAAADLGRAGGPS